MSDDFTFTDNLAVARALQPIAKLIDAELSKATGGKRVPFALYTWGGQRGQYVSNVDREQSKIAMQETLERWAEDDGPLHKSAQ